MKSNLFPPAFYFEKQFKRLLNFRLLLCYNAKAFSVYSPTSSPDLIHNLVNLNSVHMSKLTVFVCFCRAALDKATVLLSMSKGGKRKDSVWGSGGGQQSVNHLVKEVTMGYCL